MQLTLTRAPGSATSTTPTGAIIRPIQKSDLVDVGLLYAVSDPDAAAGTVDQAIEEVQAAWRGVYGRMSRTASLVAADSDRLLGAILVVHDPPWPDVTDRVFITDLFVHPTRRRGGIGRALLTSALSVHADSRVALRVESANAPALALYRSCGFVNRD